MGKGVEEVGEERVPSELVCNNTDILPVNLRQKKCNQNAPKGI